MEDCQEIRDQNIGFKLNIIFAKKNVKLIN